MEGGKESEQQRERERERRMRALYARALYAHAAQRFSMRRHTHAGALVEHVAA
jgi:hypothetical protein